MKTVKQIALPLAAGLLFAVSAYWMFANWLSSILYSMFIIPSYLLMIAALFRRRRDHLLTLGTVLLILVRLFLVNHYFTFNFPEDSRSALPLWQMVAVAYLAGTVLLLLMILVNVAPPLKRFRPYVNPVWFLPGLVMLLGVVGYAVMILNPFAALVSLNYMGTPVFDALGTLLTPLWLKVCAPEDLKPYEDMLGRVLTPEQLEEKRLELGLVKRKAKL
ncbi:MAG: hypothetical protein HFF76_09315 [Oscillospiraceae bacterium]|nr:hypothetical protein [Oscillospiraceae bacterium]